MDTKKRNIMISMCMILFMLLGYALYKNIARDDLFKWLGWYEFSEYCPPNMNMFYSVNIIKEKRQYTAHIYIDGFQTMTRIKADVKGGEKSIQLLFKEYLDDNVYSITNEKNVLLSFLLDGSEILTVWGEITPMVLDNNRIDKFFIRTQ